MLSIEAPLVGSVVSVDVDVGDKVAKGDTLLVLEVMKVQTNISAPQAGVVRSIHVQTSQPVEKGAVLIELTDPAAENDSADIAVPDSDTTLGYGEEAAHDFQQRRNKALDDARPAAVAAQHKKGYFTARENLANLCDSDSFIEYGQLAVAAQRQRKSFEELQTDTAADGIITGIAKINSEWLGSEHSGAAIVINDYSVLAGTQGYYHHQKLDRILAVARDRRLPVIMYTEGGGGRPGDTDVTTVNSGLQCQSFGTWAGLSQIVPRIAVANGYNFAGNAALFGAADITIATETSWIGMAGPAMIAGGGLGDFKPTEIGPIDIQAANGVVDIVARDEIEATRLARRCLSYFQLSRSGCALTEWEAASQDHIQELLPESRRHTYPVRDIITTLADVDSFLELKHGYGGAIVTGLMRLEGRPVGVLANDCMVLGGAIDVEAGEKAAEFMQLCDRFGIPLLSLCDTPGFMVGPEHEKLGAVRRLATLFTAGAGIQVPLVAVVLRKCYGLGAQAMLGGSTSEPVFCASWPTGEFGPMGLEGAVKLGFKKELAAAPDDKSRAELFDQLLAEQYRRGQATEVATVLEIDAVIDPADTRATIISALTT